MKTMETYNKLRKESERIAGTKVGLNNKIQNIRKASFDLLDNAWITYLRKRIQSKDKKEVNSLRMNRIEQKFKAFYGDLKKNLEENKKSDKRIELLHSICQQLRQMPICNKTHKFLAAVDNLMDYNENKQNKTKMQLTKSFGNLVYKLMNVGVKNAVESSKINLGYFGKLMAPDTYLNKLIRKTLTSLLNSGVTLREIYDHISRGEEELYNTDIIRKRHIINYILEYLEREDPTLIRVISISE
ncbi:hypothetical protein NUSPORA_00629 [Nucleospora cyclopteri]